MRWVPGCLLIFFILCSGHADINNVYNERLTTSLDYKQALLDLEQAKLEFSYYSKNYIPAVSISTAGSRAVQGISITNGEFDPYTINTEVLFEHVFGSTIQVSLPYAWDNEAGHRIDSPSLRVSRELFAESGTARLEAEAGLLSAEYALQKIESDIAINLVRDIITAYTMQKQQALYGEYFALLKKNLTYIKIEEDRNDLKRRIYSIQKLFLQAGFSRENLDFDESLKPGDIDNLFDEVKVYARKWEEQTSGITGPPVIRKDLKSLETTLEAAQLKGNLYFLPYIPNPTLYGSLSYNNDEDRIVWSIGLTFSIPLIDHGERSLETRKRILGETLAYLSLENKRKDIERAHEKILFEINITKIDLEILDIDYSESRIDMGEAEKLFNNDIINEYEYMLKKLDYELLTLSIIEKQGSYYTQLLQLMAEQGTDVRRLFQ